MKLGLQIGVGFIDQLVKSAAVTNAVPGEIATDDMTPRDAYRADLQDLYDEVVTRKPTTAKESTPRVVATPS